MTDDERFAAIERICEQNARLLNQNQEVWPRRRPDGTVRIQVRRDGRWVRESYKEYPSIASAYAAALVARKRARRLSKDLAA